MQGLTGKFEALQESLGTVSGAEELLQLSVCFAEGEGGAAPTARDPPEVLRQQEAAFTAAAKVHLAALLQLCRECGLSVEECDRLKPAVAAATAETLPEVLPSRAHALTVLRSSSHTSCMESF